MKKVIIKFSEKMGIKNILNETYQKGGLSLDGLKTAQNLIEKTKIEMEFTTQPNKDGFYKAIKGKEAIKIDLRKNITNTLQGKMEQLLWDIEKDKGTEIEFNSDEVKMLKEIIEGKNKEKTLKISDFFLVELSKKLEE